jgi:hypothetical protein
MILSNLIVPSRQNQICTESGIDSFDRCLNKKHFKSYPYPIEYRYNSRGFRDSEWPVDINELQKAIWCVGDSFTVGLGSNITHTWVNILQKQSAQRCINVSMDGASNNWIAKKAIDIINTVCPRIIILHWSYINRREMNREQISEFIAKQWRIFYNDIKDPSWPKCPPINQINLLPKDIQKEILQHEYPWKNPLDDEIMRIHAVNTSSTEDVNNSILCVQSVDSVAYGKTKVIHSVVPESCPPGVNDDIFIKKSSNAFIPAFSRLDLARDGAHYDKITATDFVEKLLNLISPPLEQ